MLDEINEDQKKSLGSSPSKEQCGCGSAHTETYQPQKSPDDYVKEFKDAKEPSHQEHSPGCKCDECEVVRLGKVAMHTYQQYNSARLGRNWGNEEAFQYVACAVLREYALMQSPTEKPKSPGQIAYERIHRHQPGVADGVADWKDLAAQDRLSWEFTAGMGKPDPKPYPERKSLYDVFLRESTRAYLGNHVERGDILRIVGDCHREVEGK